MLGIRVGGVETDLFSAAEPCLPSFGSLSSLRRNSSSFGSIVLAPQKLVLLQNSILAPQKLALLRKPVLASQKLALLRKPVLASQKLALLRRSRFQVACWCWGYLKLKLQPKQICLALTRGGQRWREAGGGAPTRGSRAGVRPRLRPRIRSGADRRCSRCRPRACVRGFGGHIRIASGLGSR